MINSSISFVVQKIRIKTVKLYRKQNLILRYLANVASCLKNDLTDKVYHRKNPLFT